MSQGKFPPLMPDRRKRNIVYNKCRLAIVDVNWPHTETQFTIDFDVAEDVKFFINVVQSYNVMTRLIGEVGASMQPIVYDDAEYAKHILGRFGLLSFVCDGVSNA